MRLEWIMKLLQVIHILLLSAQEDTYYKSITTATKQFFILSVPISATNTLIAI